MPGSFVDTNILVYLASGDARKAALVEGLVAEGCTVSVQVLNEFTSIARRMMGFVWSEVREFLSIIRSLTAVVASGLDVHEEGLRLGERYRLSVYDGMIVGAALLAGCETLWSQGMQDGLVIDDRLTIRNPFLGYGP